MLEHMRVHRYFSTHAAILMNMKMSHMWFKLMFEKENDCKASQIQDFRTGDKTLFCI